MYSIERTGSDPHCNRVIAPEKLTHNEFDRIAFELGTPAVRARKTGHVAAYQSRQPQHVETRWNGKESENDARPGDWIVTALDQDGWALKDDDGGMNVYVVRKDRFPDLYEASDLASPVGRVFRPKGIVSAIRLEGGFLIKAPWGEMQQADDGWLLLNGSEVYGNHRDTFAATYEIIS